MVRVFTLFLVAFLAVIAPLEMMAAGPVHPEAVLALIEVPWQTLGYQIAFLPPRAGFRAMTLPREHKIEVYARPKDEVALMAYDIAHEIGHVIDLTYNTPETRKLWMQLRGIDPAKPWFGCDRCSDYNTPAGDFAETFALLLRGPKYFRGRIAPAPTLTEIPALEQFFPKEFRDRLGMR